MRDTKNIVIRQLTVINDDEIAVLNLPTYDFGVYDGFRFAPMGIPAHNPQDYRGVGFGQDEYFWKMHMGDTLRIRKVWPLAAFE